MPADDKLLPNVRAVTDNVRRLVQDLRPGVLIKEKEGFKPLIGRLRERRNQKWP